MHAHLSFTPLHPCQANTNDVSNGNTSLPASTTWASAATAVPYRFIRLYAKKMPVLRRSTAAYCEQPRTPPAPQPIPTDVALVLCLCSTHTYLGVLLPQWRLIAPRTLPPKGSCQAPAANTEKTWNAARTPAYTHKRNPSAHTPTLGFCCHSGD